MTAQTAFDVLFRLTLLFSGSVLLMAALRPLLARVSGARASYAAWLTVPLLLASPWLPRLPWPTHASGVQAAVVQGSTLLATLSPQPLTAASVGQAPLAWLAIWLLGACIAAWVQLNLQHSYRRLLRPGPAGTWTAPAGHSPAVVGVWRARMVLPEDFEQRFDADARRLVLAHEAIHAQRQDNAWNLLGAGLLCLQWFNPLAWWAWRRFRDDQELACDAAVLDAAGPEARPLYARAMMAAHTAAHRGGRCPPLASGWATRHPLVRRIQRLVRHRVRPRWLRGVQLLFVLGLAGSSMLLARASQGLAPAALPAEGQGVLFTVESQVGNATWQQRTLLLPLNRPLVGGPSGVTLQAMLPGWCLNVSIYTFANGEIRPTGQVMDETCKQALSDWQEVALNGRVVQFLAPSTHGPLQAQLSARWTQPGDPALPALMKAEADPTASLSAAQRAEIARQREEIAKVQHMQQAQDRAWRAAREAAADR